MCHSNLDDAKLFEDSTCLAAHELLVEKVLFPVEEGYGAVSGHLRKDVSFK
jgi:hypothetical protein